MAFGDGFGREERVAQLHSFVLRPGGGRRGTKGRAESP
jgi:hypothetical protein